MGKAKLPVFPGSERRNSYKGCNKPWGWRPTPDDPEYYDEGWRTVRFIEKHCRHTKGRFKGQPFILLPFQLILILTIFGTVDDDGLRIYRSVYIEWARKNGKSELAAAVALKLLFADDEAGGEIYGAAVDKDQALVVFNVAKKMVELSPKLADPRRSKIIDSTKTIIAKKTESVYRAIPADAAGAEGFNAHGIIFDEVHVQKNRDLYDALDTSGGTRAQPLMFAITTAGHDRTSLCWELHEYSEKVHQGTLTDPTWFSDVRNTPEEADWTKRKVWKISNPALGTKAEISAGKAFRSIDELASKVEQAKHRPAQEMAVRNRYLNQWTSTRSKWIDMEAWLGKCAEHLFIEDELDGKDCYPGVDWASTNDVAALALLFPWGEDAVRAIWKFWIPEARVEADPSHPLSQWAREGKVTMTDGDVIDYDRIEREIGECAERYNFIELGFDPWQATQSIQHLADGGMTVAKVPQTMPVLTAPTKELERLVARGLFHHNNNPVASWMASNAVAKRSGDLIKPDKEKSGEKIDGISAAVNGLERMIRAEEPASVDELLY